MKQIVVDLDSVMKPCKPYADSTLQNMKKSELIEYVRMLENNYDVAVAALNQQEEDVKDLEPVKRGRWWKQARVYPKIPYQEYTCSVCGRQILVEKKCSLSEYPYCHCGAKMKDDT